MSRKHFSTLLIATLVAVLAVALLLPGQTGRDEPISEQTVLLPGLSGWVNDANRVEVAGPGEGEGVTLVRGEAGWVVEELSGYPADFERLRTLLAGLAQAEIVEWKTDNPAYYDRLGVQDLETEGATGVRVTLAADGGEEGGHSAAVILGDTPQGRSGVYVRVADQARSALIAEDLDAPESATEWVDRDLVDVTSEEVAEVAIAHADGETITVRKRAADETDYTLVELPEGRQPKSAWTVNSIANAFAALRFDDVRPASEIDWSDAFEVTVLTFDGRRYAFEFTTVDGTHWMRADAAVFDASAEDSVGADDADTSIEAAEASAPMTDTSDDVAAEEGMAAEEPGEADPAADDVAATELALAALADRVSGEDARFEGWAFAVPGYKHDPLNKRLEDLLAEPEGAGESPDSGE